MTKVIGLTGGIGSGKSTISQFLGELGAVVMDADKVGHEALRDSQVKNELVASFGRDILTPEGEIDRKKLGEKVFGKPDELARLNKIMHPRMFDMMKAQINEYRHQGVDVVVLEAAVLIEANWIPLVDEVWVTVAPESAVLQRVQKQRGLAEDETRSRIRSQLTVQERLKHASVVITNDESLDEMKARVKVLWQEMHKRNSRK